MITATDLHFSHPDQPVLAGIDLHVPAGRTVAVVGPSGCGKSTLLRILAGLLSPARGTVVHPEGRPGHPAVGMAFQDPRLLPWMTVRQNIAFALECAGCPRSAWADRMEPLLERVRLASSGDLLPGALSGGMAQRAGLVRALALEPACLLLDEPFSAVDPLLRETLQEELQDLRLGGPTAATATVLVTHDVGEALFLGDEVLVMSPAPARIAWREIVPQGRPRTAEHRRDPEVLAAGARVRRALVA